MILFLGLEHFQCIWDEETWHETWNFHLLLSHPTTSFLPLRTLCLRLLCELRRPKRTPHTCDACEYPHHTHHGHTKQQKPGRKSSWSLLRSYSPCEQQMASLLPLPSQSSSCSPAPSHVQPHKYCPYPALSQLSWLSGVTHPCRERPGKLSLPTELLWAGKWRFSPSSPA